MLTRRIIAALLFIVGTAIVAAPASLRMGWPLIIVGLLLGTALGVASGAVWSTGTNSE